MPDVKKIKASLLFEMVDEVLKKDKRAWITVTGMSMYPFLRDSVDSVELEKADFASIKRGDIVLIRRKNGFYVLHRVLKKTSDSFYIIGDAQQWIEGPLEPSQLQAAVTRIKSRGKIIDCSNAFYKLCYKVWLTLIPLRRVILKMASILFVFFKRIQRKSI